jgi:hypothetical protein
MHLLKAVFVSFKCLLLLFSSFRVSYSLKIFKQRFQYDIALRAIDNNGITPNDQFLQWETEELELFKREQLKNNNDDFDVDLDNLSKKSESHVGELPSYMEKMIGSFEVTEENLISLPASKLPTGYYCYRHS